MENRIHSGEKSKTPTRTAFRMAYSQLHKPHSGGEVFLLDTPVACTESVQMLQQRRAFAIAANAIREEEKSRLARELHDELAQSLTALKMDTLWVRDHVDVQCAGLLASKLTEMVQMIDQTVAATRRMAADLRPLLLDDLGLVPAIEWLVNNFIQRNSVQCSFCVREDLELPEPYATAVFRIVQESLNNIAKHADASQAVIILEKTLDAIKLVIRDDGCGFSPAAARKPQSLGLMGLRERAQLLGGSVVIDSACGKGTCIEVNIPLHQMGTI